MRVISYIINANVFIAIAALVLCLATQVQLGFKPGFHAYVAVIFFATLCDYNFHRVASVIRFRKASASPKYAWSNTHLNAHIITMAVAFSGLLVSAYFLEIQMIFLLSLLAITTILYSVLVSVPGKLARINQIPGIKIIILTAVWTIATVLIPAMQFPESLSSEQLLLVFAERFTFIFAIAIPFDIRDMQADARAGIKTIPVWLGENKAMAICMLSLLISLLISFIHYPAIDMMIIPAAYFVSVGCTLFAIRSKKLRVQPHYYHGILDGCIFLHGLLIFLTYYLLPQV
jgi:4-hydroxybenzoate polyprenyltransferase